ncbi:MAG: PRC-barrel domain-containing protein [Ilumatobacteraceae bacterium]
MKLLLRGTDIVGLPIVTLGGEDIAEVRDVMFDADAGQVLGFTLNKRGRFSGRLQDVLLREQVLAMGPAAIMVATDVRLDPPSAAPAGSGGDVLNDRVMTDSGVNIGTVTDVVVDTADGAVVGIEVLPADEPYQRKGRRSYLPLTVTAAMSGEAVIVPASAVDYIATDFAGFGEAVDRYRELLGGTS